MAEITKHLGIAISDADAGRISQRQLVDIFQQAIDNGDILSDDNQFHVVTAIVPLVDQGLLQRSPYFDEFEGRMNQLVRQHKGAQELPAQHNELRAALGDIDLNKLYQQFKGARYSAIVQQHLRKLASKLEGALVACVQTFSESEREVAELIVDEYNTYGYDADFWRRDCADVFNQICNRFEQGMVDRGLPADHVGQFNMFQMVTMNFAYMAREQKELRRFAGIKKGLFFT